MKRVLVCGAGGFIGGHLVRRLKESAPLNAWNAETFYSEGPHGYTDYPALA